MLNWKYAKKCLLICIKLVMLQKDDIEHLWFSH
jgi:hypothetical protein